MHELRYDGVERRVNPQGLRGPTHNPGRRMVDRISRPKSRVSGVTVGAIIVVALILAFMLMGR
jgi:hypothetical protein